MNSGQISGSSDNPDIWLQFQTICIYPATQTNYLYLPDGKMATIRLTRMALEPAGYTPYLAHWGGRVCSISIHPHPVKQVLVVAIHAVGVARAQDWGVGTPAQPARACTEYATVTACPTALQLNGREFPRSTRKRCGRLSSCLTLRLLILLPLPVSRLAPLMHSVHNITNCPREVPHAELATGKDARFESLCVYTRTPFLGRQEAWKVSLSV